MSLFRPLKYITNVTESKGIQIMKIAENHRNGAKPRGALSKAPVQRVL